MTAKSFAVLLRCDAGGSYGLGHAMRCVTLARAFKAAGGVPQFVVQPGSPEGFAFIAAQGMPVTVSPARAGDPQDVAFIQARLGESGRGTVLVLDSRDIASGQGAAYCAGAVTMVIYDEVPRDIACDILLNYHPWIGPGEYPPAASQQLLFGLDYNLVAEDYFEGGERPASRVFITMGGQDPRNDTRRIIETCANLLSGHEVDVVVGPSHPDPESVAQAVARHLAHGRVHRATPGLAGMVKRAGLVLTAGGTTCYEIAAARVPMAALPVEPHQETLVASLAGLGVLLRLDNGKERIDRSVVSRLLEDASLRADMVARQRALIAAPGAPRVVERVCRLLAAG